MKKMYSYLKKIKEMLTFPSRPKIRSSRYLPLFFEDLLKHPLHKVSLNLCSY